MEAPNFEELAAKWASAWVARVEVKTFSGGTLNAKTMANLDSTGQGVKGRFRIGRQVVYPVNNLIEWMRARFEPIQNKRSTEAGRAGGAKC